eukprot:CAMPEP_0172003746 /NCGR_PEP_ID=MMETSP1041-20130122/4100_1 /TAXON_ID=464988 /ORGANISM="Hemiselmis andersenii, Strain CCMP439" /LENGTH=55 /DNA_ID=CAMNT_0012657539 /DNA_START=240 /DNA_END=403 /DNA_ORIENTATION=+
MSKFGGWQADSATTSGTLWLTSACSQNFLQHMSSGCAPPHPEAAPASSSWEKKGG